MVNFAPRPLYPVGRSPVPIEQEAGWAQSRSGRFAEELQLETRMWTSVFREAGGGGGGCVCGVFFFFFLELATQ
jgi:hypothetical protein